jgi:hypothetical protein
MPAGYMSMPDVNKKIAIELALETDKFERKIRNLNMYIGRLKAQIERMKEKMASTNDTITSGAKKAGTSYAGWLGTMLSLLFISQGIAAATGRMISPILDLLGVTDIWRVLLMEILFPVLIPLADMLIWIMEKFMDLPAPLKKIIGAGILFLFIIATIVGWAAQLVMLLGSVALLMGAGLTGAGLAAAAALLATIFGWVVAIFGFVYSLISAVWNFATGDWGLGILKVLGIIVAVILGIIAAILGAPAVIVALIIGLVALIITVILDNFTFLGEWVENLIMGIIDFIVKAWWGMCEYLGWLFGKVFEPIKAAVEWIWNKIKGAGSWVKEKAGGLWSGAKNLVGLQAGGIVTGPTLALLGESGPEAVVPLSGGTAGGPIININISGASFASRNQMMDMVRLIQSALRDEMRRLGVR